LVVAASLILIALFIYRFSDVIQTVVIALLLAYILNPLVTLITRWARTSRTLVAALVYLVLVAIIIVLPVVLVPRLIEQVTALAENLPDYIASLSTLLSQPLQLGPYQIDLSGQLTTLSSQLGGVIQQLTTQTLSLLGGIANFVTLLILILVISFYLLKDAPFLVQSIEQVAPPEYRYDLRRLLVETGHTWNSFLRGQLTLALVVGSIVAVATTILGVPNSLLLGILAALGEFIPFIGPGLAAVPGVLIALFQGSTWLTPQPFDNTTFAAIVLVMYVLNQQVENNVLVPRIIGQSLNLHPVVVLVAAIMGASLAGILGILLAAPALATIRLGGRYIYRKLLDQDPFPEEEPPEPVPEPPQVVVVEAASDGGAAPTSAVNDRAPAAPRQAE
jgi:predicted PurR-regulated permease PerM